MQDYYLNQARVMELQQAIFNYITQLLEIRPKISFSDFHTFNKGTPMTNENENCKINCA